MNGFSDPTWKVCGSEEGFGKSHEGVMATFGSESRHCGTPTAWFGASSTGLHAHRRGSGETDRNRQASLLCARDILRKLSEHGASTTGQTHARGQPMSSGLSTRRSRNIRLLGLFTLSGASTRFALTKKKFGDQDKQDPSEQCKRCTGP